MRKKQNLPQRMEKCGPLLVRQPERLRGSWRTEIGPYKDVHLEIGCGRGRFTAETARLGPETLLVALDRVPEALIIALERAWNDNIPNVRFIAGDADRLADYFAPGELGRVYINFCDPWPNNGHRKRRLTHGRYLEIYKALLGPGGQLHFKTDNDGLFDYSLGQFAEAGFEVCDVTRDLHGGGPVGVMTDYELKFHGQGVLINSCVAKIR